MSQNVYDILVERGFVFQVTGEQEVRQAMDEPIACYIGFDPTATSLHVGSLVPIMALAHMQRHGHSPVVLVGGGTALIGDPSGKREARQILSFEEVERNARAIGAQLCKFLEFSEKCAVFVNNADWLCGLEYIPFLRDVGCHFSVNRMLASESVKTRLETGLSFIEFNYSLLQAFDFLHLYRTHKCVLQMGGSDQWGNIVAGIELVRRVEGGKVYGLTFPLITTSSGAKMGKTASGAIWLDAARTDPYDYYQHWINTDDRDVTRFAALFTFLPMDEVESVGRMSGVALNAAKSVLAYEATLLAHGTGEAERADALACNHFGYREIPVNVFPSSGLHRVRNSNRASTIPGASIACVPGASDSQANDKTLSYIYSEELELGVPLFRLFCDVGLASSGGAARRLIQQGGAYINGRRVDSVDYVVTASDLSHGQILLRSGKKKYHCLQAVKSGYRSPTI